MRKLLFWGIVACVVVSFTSCKSSESAYKKAYEKAKQQELIEPDVRVNEGFDVTDPVDVTPVIPPASVVVPTPIANEPETSEKVTVVTGTDTLKKYGVVCGSFSLKANAEGLKDFLEAEGYSPVIALNEQKQMYRVIVVSFSDKESAVAARNAFKARYPHRNDFQGAWILNRLQ